MNVSAGQSGKKDSIPYWVYRYFDANGVLLYVGITHDLEQRDRGHLASIFRPYVADRTVTRYDSRTEASVAEINAIRTEDPVFNLKDSAGHRLWKDRVRRGVEYVESKPWVQLPVSADQWGLCERTYPPGCVRQQFVRWDIRDLERPALA